MKFFADKIDPDLAPEPDGDEVSEGAGSREGTNVFSYRFSTKPQGELSGLYYYGYRYYDPENGRWLNRDPIGERGGLNIYEFLGNDGVNELDVFGFGPYNDRWMSGQDRSLGNFGRSVVETVGEGLNHGFNQTRELAADIMRVPGRSGDFINEAVGSKLGEHAKELSKLPKKPMDSVSMFTKIAIGETIEDILNDLADKIDPNSDCP